MSRFSFTGELGHGDNYLRTGLTGTGAKYASINLSVIAAKNNRGYIECFGMLQDKIKTMDVDNNKIEISYKDAKDPDVVKVVANYKKHVVSIDGDRKEFVSDYDFVNYLNDNIEELTGRKVQVTGQVSKNIYKGKISDRFQIQNIYTVDDDHKNNLTVNSEVFFNKDSFDTAEWGSDKKLYINGYESAYINKDEGTKFVDRQVVLDASKIDFDNAKHAAKISFMLKQIKCALDENNKVKCSLKKSDYYSMNMKLAYVNGSEEIAFDESALTATQKEAIELGLNTIDDFKPAGSLYGERVTTFKLLNVDLRGKFEDGAILYEDDLEENIYVAPAEESIDVIEKAAKKSVTESILSDSDDDDELDALFG